MENNLNRNVYLGLHAVNFITAVIDFGTTIIAIQHFGQTEKMLGTRILYEHYGVAGLGLATIASSIIISSIAETIRRLNPDSYSNTGSILLGINNVARIYAIWLNLSTFL